MKLKRRMLAVQAPMRNLPKALKACTRAVCVQVGLAPKPSASQDEAAHTPVT